MAEKERPEIDAAEKETPKYKGEISEYENREVAKEEALTACVAQHRALFECYKRGCWGFSRCCGEEHDAFWQCYTTKRGVNKTVIGHHVETWAEKWGIPFKIPDRVKRNQDKAPDD